MKVHVDVQTNCIEPYAIIYTNRVDEEIEKIVEFLSEGNNPITAQKEDGYIILRPNEIFMVKVEDGDTVIYCENNKYYSRRRLYEIKEQTGQKFMQIAKGTLINLEYLDSIEAGFSGSILVKLKNGCSDYVSRKYLPDLKKYLGLK